MIPSKLPIQYRSHAITNEEIQRIKERDFDIQARKIAKELIAENPTATHCEIFRAEDWSTGTVNVLRNGEVIAFRSF